MSNMSLLLPPEVRDPGEIFWHFGSSDIAIEITLPEVKRERALDSVWRVTIEISRKGHRVSMTLHDVEGQPVPKGENWTFGPGKIQKPGFNIGRLDEILSALKILTRCLYYPAVRHVTAFTPDVSSDSKYYDVYTGKPFIEQWASRALGEGKLSTQKVEELVEELRRIFRFERLSIQADQGHRELLVIANGKSSRLSELGTGLAQFILLLGNIGFAEPSYVLIDEPENNLHPSLQLDFLNAIAARASEGTIFATHNLGLARQAADHILACNQRSTGCVISPFHKTDDLAHLIGELSFGRSDFAPARKLLLVEGQTDVLTMQNFLAAFGKEHHFAIISLGGKDGIHSSRKQELQQMEALGIKVVAIIDSEKTSPADRLPTDREGFLAVCRTLNISCHVLERRAVENYFTQRAIDQVLGLGFKALDHYEPPNRWSKKKNWRIAREMLKSEVEATDLGQFLASSST